MRFEEFLAVALAALATSCTLPPPQIAEAAPPPVIAPGECDSQAAQSIVGKSYSTALGEQAKQRTHAERLRVVRPGEMVTMDFDSRRLTIELDAAGRVVRARCS